MDAMLADHSHSVRSTNVYEEKSLGVFENEQQDTDEPTGEGPRVAVWGRYLTWHARKQLAFGPDLRHFSCGSMLIENQICGG